MSVPKIVGVETEYGIALRSGAVSTKDVRDFLTLTWHAWIPWDYQNETATRDARDPSLLGTFPRSWRANGNATIEDVPDQFVQSKNSTRGFDISLNRDPSTILPNGGRLYLDHAHPEYCTPECKTARELVTYDRAGERLLMEMVRRFNLDRNREDHLVLYKNNSDYGGHSYGCHENYLMAADAYVDLFNNRAHKLYTYLIPYLVSRQVFCGAGKVGVERSNQTRDFQISQRADFFEQVMGLQTTHHRPIINTRDEPHADPQRFRRLHVICGDANLAEWSTYLKVGVTQLILAMIETDSLKSKEDVLLADPIVALQAISRDPTLQTTVELETGARRYTALQIQRVLLEATGRYLETDERAAKQWIEIWTDWAQVIELLESKPEALDPILDWRIKQSFLRTQLERKTLDWDSALARELDAKYHQLDAEEGLFFMLEKAGLVDSLLDEASITTAMQRPPSSTRSYVRGLCAGQYPDQVVSGNWTNLFVRLGEGSDQQIRQLRLTDPTAGTQADLEAACLHNSGLNGIVDYYSQLDLRSQRA